MSSFPDEARQFLPAYGVTPTRCARAPVLGQRQRVLLLCQYEADGESNCLYSSVVDLIQHLASEKRELPFIVRQVQNVYNATIRDSVTFTHEDTGEVIERPAWSKPPSRATSCGRRSSRTRSLTRPSGTCCTRSSTSTTRPSSTPRPASCGGKAQGYDRHPQSARVLGAPLRPAQQRRRDRTQTDARND